MTSPYITFEEMEEGKRYVAFCRNSGSAVNSDLRYFKKGRQLSFEDGGYDLKSTEDHSQLVFIPVYSPPNSWDDMKRGDYLYVNGGFSQSDRNYWFRDDVLLRCSDEEWKAAGDYRKHLRKKAGKS